MQKAGYEFLAAIVWVVTPCSLVRRYQSFERNCSIHLLMGIFYPEHGSSRSLRNVGNSLAEQTASHSERQRSAQGEIGGPHSGAAEDSKFSETLRRNFGCVVPGVTNYRTAYIFGFKQSWTARSDCRFPKMEAVKTFETSGTRRTKHLKTQRHMSEKYSIWELRSSGLLHRTGQFSSTYFTAEAWYHAYSSMHLNAGVQNMSHLPWRWIYYFLRNIDANTPDYTV